MSDEYALVAGTLKRMGEDHVHLTEALTNDRNENSPAPQILLVGDSGT